MKAFVDFYTKEGISPVTQDIEDLEKHFRRRHALYRHVGIVPSLLFGRSVLEFGPGSGHNSIVTAAMHPARYILVDANPVGLARTRDLLGQLTDDGATDISVIESYIEDFETSERFDLVLCEGVLPTQEAPTELLSHIAQFVKPGGIILITCIDAASYLAEQLRRFAATLATHEESSTEEKLAVLVPLLGPHLDTIEGMGRSHEDWILDNLIQPFHGRALMGLEEAIDAFIRSSAFTAPHRTSWSTAVGTNESRGRPATSTRSRTRCTYPSFTTSSMRGPHTASEIHRTIERFWPPATRRTKRS